jgi:YaiO family outer membrane protein
MKTLHRALALSFGAIASAATAAAPANFNAEHTSYSGGRGTRTVATADAVLRMAEDTKLILSLSGGERRAGGERVRAARVSGTLTQNWTSRLSTTTSVALASNGRIFARDQFAQDINYKLGDSVVATVGGKFAAYAGGDHVTSWSAGAAYYRRGFSATYRYSLIDSGLLGRSHAHLASFRMKDPGGSGSTQLWVGEGTSLYDIVPQSEIRAGRFKSLTLRREQPIAGGVLLNVGVGRAWYSTPTGHYAGTSILAGVSYANRLF